MTTVQYRINSSTAVSELSMYLERENVTRFLDDAISLLGPDLLSKKTGGLVEETPQDLFSSLSTHDQELFLETLINPLPFNNAFIKARQKFHNSKKQ